MCSTKTFQLDRVCLISPRCKIPAIEELVTRRPSIVSTPKTGLVQHTLDDVSGRQSGYYTHSIAGWLKRKLVKRSNWKRKKQSVKLKLEGRLRFCSFFFFSFFHPPVLKTTAHARRNESFVVRGADICITSFRYFVKSIHPTKLNTSKPSVVVFRC